MKKILRFLRSEDGPTAIEYAFVIAMIFAVCLAAIVVVGERTGESFDDSASEIEAAFEHVK